jgi:biotin carboxylase
MQKKILLLGGSYSQLPAIVEAKKRGLYTILCDYLPDNPGRAMVDQYYEVSTTDKRAVLDIAKKHEVDAVLAYASDPATITQAYISNRLGLPGNPEECISLLAYKDEFRNFQEKHGFNVPAFKIFSADQIHRLKGLQLSYPVVVKPTDSSDSKGVFKVNDIIELKEKAETSLSFSRSGKIIIEEFVDAEGGNLHGDAFFIDGKMVFCMLGDRIINPISNPLKPAGELYPSRLPDSIISDVQNKVVDIIKLSGFKNGAVNIESRVTKNDEIFIMEIGPRSGGDLTPEAIGYCCGFNMLYSTYDFLFNKPVIVTHRQRYPTFHYTLHSNRSGIFEEFELSNDLKPFLKHEDLFITPGEIVKPFSEAGSTLGVLILTFPDFSIAENYLDTIYQKVQYSLRLKDQDESFDK